MSGGVSAATVATVFGGAVASQLVAKALAPSGQAAPASLLTKPPEGQAAKAPDQQAVRASNGATGGYGPAELGTMLTGLAGVDPSSLNLGKNKLLGG